MTTKFAKENGFPVNTCRCPAAADSRRKFLKDMIRNAQKDTPRVDIRNNIFNSIARIKKDYIDLKETG